jgi:diguanylate cyclase (GGDEF)-like protein
MNILVASNSETSLAILSASLRKLGHTVMGASDGEQAIKLFKKKRPDFIILDVVMQGMNGFECAKKIREINSERWIPIIFLSSSVDDNSISQGIDAGGDDYLTKPFSETTLAAKIKAMQQIANTQKKLDETTYQLNKLSSMDVLTGVENRLQFAKIIQEKIDYARKNDAKFALLFIDLDNFKSVNDNLGYHTGDLLLKAIAERLKSSLQKNDLIARLNGDEFAIVINEIPTQDDAEYYAKKISAILSTSYHLLNYDIQVSCSIGIACYPISGTTTETLIQRAEMAMYHAKKSGRNNYQFYTKESYTQNKQQFEIETALRSALSNNEIYMCYQPVFRLHPRKFVGMEALMRWKNPRLGLVLPEVFIPIAEEIGLITGLGEWALNSACIQAANWLKRGHKKFRLSVNISSRQFLSKDFIPLLKASINKANLPTKLLELELTESTFMISTSITEKTIKEISDLNIGISLDDFGTGYSSLLHLKSLPISTLKIDKTFVMDYDKSPNDTRILKAIISLGNNLKINLIAEGIETQEQLQFLIKNKCAQGQGFYLSKPLSAEEMTLFMDKNKKA